MALLWAAGLTLFSMGFLLIDNFSIFQIPAKFIPAVYAVVKRLNKGKLVHSTPLDPLLLYP